MNQAIDLIVRSIPIIIGGGLVQIIIFLMKRRSEVRATDAASLKNEAESGSFVIASAAQSLKISDEVRDRAVARAEALEAELKIVKDRLHQVESALSGVEALRAEVSMLRAENTELRTEVQICHRTHPKESS